MDSVFVTSPGVDGIITGTVDDIFAYSPADYRTPSILPDNTGLGMGSTGGATAYEWFDAIARTVNAARNPTGTASKAQITSANGNAYAEGSPTSGQIPGWVIGLGIAGIALVMVVVLK